MDTIEDDDDFFDDWIIKSMKSYRHLHMFDLPQPTCVIEWSENDGIFVAGCSSDSRNEILEMSIPAKLRWESSSKGAGLTRDRDFKMLRGGFSEKAIHCLTYLVGTRPRLIVTGSHASSHLDVWQLDTETSDVIKKLHTVPGQGTEGGGIGSVAQRPGHRGQVAFGAMMSNLQVADVETKEVIATDFGKVECGLEMQFLNNNELVTCSTQNGLVNIHDLRTTSSQSVLTDQSMKLSSAESEHCSLDEGTTQTYNKTISQSGSGLDVAVDESTNQNISKKGKASWTFDLSCSPVPHLDPAGGEIACKRPKLDVSMAMVVSLCSSGELVIRDLRNLEMPLQNVQLGDEKRQPREMETLTVRWCPTEKNLLSVSGLNGCVDIYDISTWQQSSTSPPNVQPIFSHEGHMTGESANQGGGILCHAWHPRHPCVVMSSGSNGSLHAWDWSAVL